MPTLQKQYTLSVSPEQFLLACSVSELHEVLMLLNSPRYQAKMNEAGEYDDVPDTPTNAPSVPERTIPETTHNFLKEWLGKK